MNTKAAADAMREALDLLSRASANWRNGDTHSTGPLHWSAAVPAAWQALSRALVALEAAEDVRAAMPGASSDGCECAREHELRGVLEQAAERLRGWSAGAGPDGKLIARIDTALEGDTDDAVAGMRWYNGLTPTQRRQWHEIAGSAVPAAAWHAFQAGGPQP